MWGQPPSAVPRRRSRAEHHPELTIIPNSNGASPKVIRRYRRAIQ